MTSATERVPVLPRDVAAGIIVSAVSKSGWAIAATILVVTIPGLVELFVRGGYPQDVAVPVLAILLMLVLLAVLVSSPSPVRIVLYLAVGTIAVTGYVLSILLTHPELLEQGIFLINRPAVALVAVGTSGFRPLRAALSGVLGYLLGTSATSAVCVALGIAPLYGFGPTIAVANYVAIWLLLALIGAAQRGRVPDFRALQRETRRQQARRAAEERAVALIHDTVLNDLASVMAGPAVLPERTRKRMRDDVAALLHPGWLEQGRLAALADPVDGAFRNELVALVRDLQWHGLTVEVTGNTNEVVRFVPGGKDALLGAVRACLDNVLTHSGVHEAELILGSADGTATAMVIDAGVGFDPELIAPDRLGLRSSVVSRVESVGGTAKVFSAPGEGTSVLITVPLVAPDPQAMP